MIDARGAGSPTALANALEAQASRLCEASLVPMYADPFWEARFGERGRRFAREDADFHIAYLAEALRAGSAASFTGYARWLRGVLTTRGMCTLHLADTFDALGRTIAKCGIDGAHVAVAYLDAGAAALRYDGDAGRVQALALADDADRIGAHLVSYLADAMALELPRVYADHVAWLRANAERVNTTRERVDAAVAALASAVRAMTPPVADAVSIAIAGAEGAAA